MSAVFILPSKNKMIYCVFTDFELKVKVSELRMQ